MQCNAKQAIHRPLNHHFSNLSIQFPQSSIINHFLLFLFFSFFALCCLKKYLCMYVSIQYGVHKLIFYYFLRFFFFSIPFPPPPTLFFSVSIYLSQFLFFTHSLSLCFFLFFFITSHHIMKNKEDRGEKEKGISIEIYLNKYFVLVHTYKCKGF